MFSFQVGFNNISLIFHYGYYHVHQIIDTVEDSLRHFGVNKKNWVEYII